MMDIELVEMFYKKLFTKKSILTQIWSHERLMVTLENEGSAEAEKIRFNEGCSS